MNNDSTRPERIFKIFTPVRCLSRDQLPRYLNGNMTDWEKHLIEQHLVDCDLCHDAIESLQHTKNQEPYERLSKQLSLYLQREYAPVEQQSPLKARRTVQGNNTRESLLSYFWVIMFLALGGGSIFLLQQHLKNRPVLAAIPVKTTDAVIPPQQSTPAPSVELLANETKTPVIQTQYSTRPKDSTATVKLKLTAKDSALLAAAAKNAAKKPAAKDTIKKAPVTDTNTRTQPKEPEVKEPPKEEKTVAATPPPAPAPKEKEKEKDKEEEPARPVTTGDESLFRAAMLYQQQGNVNEAIDQFRKLSTNYKFSERAKYQLALCYRTKGQNGKARRLLREIVRMEGPLKAQAQTELNNLN
ncbi:tetratricopeptide repeat protein [Chitinophaga niabensis]|uniref:Tetratricopeptide repeat-containing protein n=1 Tax=Chitinophaga niabensis TaxID=536979 RepID=A0A1N6EZ04_9BACT|nr:tetratricopeptide repeat protein [Chitinophaga niabensis]SIN88272.1 Tetratricopeptide repeat-containing protein [Chitinophaga niabensis]